MRSLLPTAMVRIFPRVTCSPAASKRLAETISNAAPVVALSLIIVWSYAAYVFSLSGTIMTSRPLQASLYLIFYHPIFIMFVWSYYKAVSTDPGSSSESTSSIHTNPTAITGSHPSTDHNSEALQPLTIGSTSADSSHLPDTALLYPDPPLSASTFNLLYSTYGPLLNDGMDMEGVIGGPQRVMVKRNGELRFCQKCQAYKLDRAHHCGTCKKCILKMDHHCPWINNCVGHHNQKAFYLFIVYGSIYCVFVAVTVVPPLLEVINVPMGVLQLDFNWAFLVMISGMFGLFLVPFTIFHTRQLLSNRTTIETYERAHYRMSERPRRAGPDNGVTTSKHLNVWDLGTKRNFMEVMGPEPKLWFIPINNSEGDGLTFPLNAYAYDVLDDEEDEERQMVVNIRAEDSGDDSDD